MSGGGGGIPGIAAIEPELYRHWRRYAQEQCLLYERGPSRHPCWESPENVKRFTNTFTERTLYGCLVCMRAHMCRPEHGFATCPRLCCVDHNEGAIVCPYSGAPLDGGRSAMIFNGSFEQHEATSLALREHRRFAPAGGDDGSDEDVDLLLQSQRGNRGYAAHLERGANDAKDDSTRRSMRRQADVAIERTEQKHYVKVALRDDIKQGKKRRKERKDRESDAAALGLASAVRASPVAAAAGGSFEDDSPLAPVWSAPATVVPDYDMVADDAYTLQALAPLAARMANARIGSHFAHRRAAAPRPGPAALALAPTGHREHKVPQFLAAPGGAHITEHWFALAPWSDGMTLVPHQRNLLLYVPRFIEHYAARAPAGTPKPAPAGHYATFCDRLLWLYHRYVGEAAHHFVHWQLGAIDASGNRLWPEAEREQRIFYALLTRVLTAEVHGRDQVTDA
jgi:hypothetical protein